jgi:DNA mismatch endonuclease Vsr
MRRGIKWSLPVKPDSLENDTLGEGTVARRNMREAKAPKRSMTPSYAGFRPASEAASRAKRANRHADTGHELLLRRELWRLGLRYRKNVKGLPGKPDLVFGSARIAVFCDGDFWHGRDWERLKEELARRHNSTYWLAKISRNRERDVEKRT